MGTTDLADAPARYNCANLVMSLPNPCLVVLLGPSGAGKSTLAVELVKHTTAEVISYDAIREELTGDAANQDCTPEAVELAHARIGRRCANGLSTVVDATHDERPHRRVLLDIAASSGMPTVAIAMVPPLKDCLENQALRKRRVRPEVVEAQYTAVMASLPELHREGYAGLHILMGSAHFTGGR